MPTSQPPEYRTAAEVLERARGLFGMADHQLTLAFAPALRDKMSHMTTGDYERRAGLMFAGAHAGAELAATMILAEDMDDAARNAALALGEKPSEAQYEAAMAALRARANRGADG